MRSSQPDPTNLEPSATRTVARAPDRWSPPWGTLLALAVLAYVGAELVHEALGHGLSCALGGGTWRGFSSSWSVCDAALMSEGAQQWMHAAGTVASLAVGGLALAALRLLPLRNGNAYAALWMFAAVCAFSGAGELMALPLFHFGDWEEVLLGSLDTPVTRLGGSALGVVLALGAFVAVRRALLPLLPREDGRARVRVAQWLCWLPFAAVGCGLMTATAFLNVLGLHHALTTALSTVGSTSLLIWIPFTLESVGGEGRTQTELRPMQERRWLWVVGGLLTAFALVGLGPGIPVVTAQ